MMIIFWVQSVICTRQMPPMKQKLIAMLTLQDSLNRHINPAWVTAGYEWYRAIWVECAELMDHYGWKWWKSQEHDQDQIRLELIDIWHFGLSAELVRLQGDIQQAADSMLSELNQAGKLSPVVDFKQAVDELASHALTHRSLQLPVFLQLLAEMDTSFYDLHRIYVGKNVLNRFRQDNGYKDGSYRKLWQGREDNEHLAEIMYSLDADAIDFPQQIEQELEARYNA
jgi:dimeric dUTPase (all-alpha-NTP-PPase superfamily)